MLVLSRKAGQKIYIGGGIELVVLEVRGGQVRLGFEAPPEVPIHRTEISRRIEQSETRELAARFLSPSRNGAPRSERDPHGKTARARA